jgi:hypothetical protein
MYWDPLMVNYVFQGRMPEGLCLEDFIVFPGWVIGRHVLGIERIGEGKEISDPYTNGRRNLGVVKGGSRE